MRSRWRHGDGPFGHARLAAVVCCAATVALGACGRGDAPPAAAPAGSGPVGQVPADPPVALPDAGAPPRSGDGTGARDAGAEAGAPLNATTDRPAVGAMAELAGGTFTMGRGDTVTVRAFSLDLTEVTGDAYAACVRAGKCTADGLGCGKDATYAVAGKGNHPVNCVDWKQATTYCQWAGKRLPTEEEWEWAARGQGKGTQFPWGNHLAHASQVCAQPSPTCAVGSFPASDAPGGIHDLVGNVGEWTAGEYDSSGSGYRAFRGGRWVAGNASYVRVPTRYGSDPASHSVSVGFRCAR